jgi:hypothetical protein
MCRSIKPLFNYEPAATDEEIRAASLQFVRKISGMTKPSKVNEEVFLRAVQDISGISSHLLSVLQVHRDPKPRPEPVRRPDAVLKEQA